MLEPLGVALHSVDLGHLPFGGTASVGSLVSSRAGLGEAKEAFGEAARRTWLKVLIEPQR